MDDASGQDPSRGARGRFAPGNPGRPPGFPNRMSGRIALGLLRHYTGNEAEFLARLSRGHFSEYLRLIGGMLPRERASDADALEPPRPRDVARTVRAVRAALERVEAGESSLADIEAALDDMVWDEDAP